MMLFWNKVKTGNSTWKPCNISYDTIFHLYFRFFLFSLLHVFRVRVNINDNDADWEMVCNDGLIIVWQYTYIHLAPALITLNNHPYVSYGNTHLILCLFYFCFWFRSSLLLCSTLCSWDCQYRACKLLSENLTSLISKEVELRKSVCR